MSLGLDQLSNDQLIELVQEICRELENRDPFMATLTQQTITTASERLEGMRLAGKEAVRLVFEETADRFRNQARLEAAQAVLNGEIRLLPSSMEARLAVQGALQAKIDLIDQACALIRSKGLLTEEEWRRRSDEDRARQIAEFHQRELLVERQNILQQMTNMYGPPAPPPLYPLPPSFIPPQPLPPVPPAPPAKGKP